MYCDLWTQYIQVRKLFKGGNYSRAETIQGQKLFAEIRYVKDLEQNTYSRSKVKAKGQRKGPNKCRPLDDFRIESHFSVLNINQIFLMSFCSLGAEHLFLSFFITLTFCVLTFLEI